MRELTDRVPTVSRRLVKASYERGKDEGRKKKSSRTEPKGEV
jgi:hypothetical protein